MLSEPLLVARNVFHVEPVVDDRPAYRRCIGFCRRPGDRHRRVLVDMSITSSTPHRPSATRGRRRPWRLALAVVLLAVAVAAALLLTSGTVTTSRPVDGGVLPMVTFTPGGGGGDGDADGRLPGDGARPDEDGLPGLAKLDPDLLDAVRSAEAAAAEDGIRVRVTSGWRSRAYQQDLLDRAIVTYGSREEAARFVASPEESKHVSGDAVDIGPTDAAYWMAQHGSEFGLCQTFSNEIWHYELLVEPGGTCPQMRADSSS
jgi:D-alanyl-D-alanine carboxypeptidase